MLWACQIAHISFEQEKYTRIALALPDLPLLKTTYKSSFLASAAHLLIVL